MSMSMCVLQARGVDTIRGCVFYERTFCAVLSGFEPTTRGTTQSQSQHAANTAARLGALCDTKPGAARPGRQCGSDAAAASEATREERLVWHHLPCSSSSIQCGSRCNEQDRCYCAPLEDVAHGDSCGWCAGATFNQKQLSPSLHGMTFPLANDKNSVTHLIPDPLSVPTNRGGRITCKKNSPLWATPAAAQTISGAAAMAVSSSIDTGTPATRPLALRPSVYSSQRYLFCAGIRHAT